ncbi:MAG: peptidoglycan DD-metalloendopeptidase family protein [Polaribacter sp.]|uniref:peptidoglycan DD-metalloendopeptidase family protein n=1 Tax=Polaribacter sp. TaxID=1920175 RepID=UPI002F35E9A7
MKNIIHLLIFALAFSSCKNEEKIPVIVKEIIPVPEFRYGYNIDDFVLIQDTIKSGESFGEILDRHHVNFPKINKIAGEIKETFDVRRVRAGKPYTILASKDSIQKAQVFIYKNNKIRATVVDFSDSIIKAHTYLQPIKTVQKIIEGKIYSSLSNSMDSLHLSPNLTNTIADIYAWTLDFYKLQKGDSFKIIFEEKYIKNNLFAGYGEVKAAVFNHRGEDFYAYRYLADSIKGITEYYDTDGNMLRSQFLKSPIKFQYRISSRYNLKRRIAHYGYRVKAHRGTDFAASNGTPIMSTANGTVVESRRRGGNGNYVAVKHNSTFTTKYFHMSRRKSKVGDFVKQGDVIGYVGSTGSSSGNHVCYRFWKNGKEVDPFKEKLPAAKPLNKTLKPHYLEFVKPLKYQLDHNQLSVPEQPVIENVVQN